MDYTATISRHERIALQFSGGKDSLACLYLMRPHWDKLTVYYTNSGDAFPETLALIEQVKAMVPHFVEIKGKTKETMAQLGWPSDLATPGSTPFGRIGLGHTDVPTVDRYVCCYKSIMEPMHQRMKADGITLLIRGQKNADTLKPFLRSGQISDGIELLYPIETWSDEELLSYLKEVGAPLPQYYADGMTSAPDCMHCTAWLEHKMPAYVKKYHPKHYPVLQERLNKIAIAVEPYHKMLRETLE